MGGDGVRWRLTQVRTFFGTSSAGTKASLALATTMGYLLAYQLVDSLVGNAAGIISVVPVVTVAWLFGFRAGLLAGLVGFPINAMLAATIADRDLAEWAREGGALGNFGLVLVGSVVGRLRDLTVEARIALRDRIRAEEEAGRLALAVTAADEAVIISDMDGRVSFVNPAAERIFGYSPGAMIGISRLARIHRRTSLGTALEEASGCSSESGIMVLEQKPARKQGAPNRCCHRTNPTVSASSLTTIAWWPMPACSCRPP